MAELIIGFVIGVGLIGFLALKALSDGMKR